MSIEKMREAFEAWRAELCISKAAEALALTREGDGYYNTHTELAWNAWQAATAATQRDAMAVAEAVHRAACEEAGKSYGAERMRHLDLSAIVEAVRPANTSDLPSDASDLNANSSDLQSEMREALNIANYLWRTFYAEESPQWKPLDSVRGLLFQIDNMVAGIARPASAQPQGEPVAWMEYAPQSDAWFLAYSCNPDAKTRPLYADPPAPACRVPDEVDAFLEEVRAELKRARTKFPGDRIMTIALAEEFGELCKAVLDESAANVRKEAVQTAVMAARIVLDGDGSVVQWRAERGLDKLAAAPKPEGGA